jgi:hypothetical protein
MLFGSPESKKEICAPQNKVGRMFVCTFEARTTTQAAALTFPNRKKQN